MYRLAVVKHSLYHILNNRITLLHNHKLVALVIYLLYHLDRKRILANLQYRIRYWLVVEVLFQIVVCKTAGDDALALVSSVEILVEASRHALLLHVRLL